jgi:hypothetical protein
MDVMVAQSLAPQTLRRALGGMGETALRRRMGLSPSRRAGLAVTIPLTVAPAGMRITPNLYMSALKPVPRQSGRRTSSSERSVASACARTASGGGFDGQSEGVR